MDTSHLNYFKLSPPYRKTAILRDRLTSRLCREATSVKVTLVCADAGYGKTTILRDLSESCGAISAWYRLDRGDRDLAQFLTYLVHAIQRSVPSFDADGHLGSGNLTSAANPDDLAFQLVHELNQLKCSALAIILDNYESVNSSQDVGSFVSKLVEFLPEHVHLLIGSREKPSLPLTRLRAGQDLLEIDRLDLAFTSEELRQVLGRLCDGEFSDDEIELLHEKTEGWAAGLIMAGLSLKPLACDERRAFLESLSGSTRVICDYLAEEVLHKRPPNIQSFLLSTSVLPRLHIDICNQIAGVDNAHGILNRLEECGLFTHQVGDGHSWFRYHRLFREFLADRLNTHWRPEAIKALRLKAAAALEAKGLFPDAHQQYVMADDPETASALVERVAQDYIDRGYVETVSHWLSITPERIISRRPWLLEYQGEILRLSHNVEAAMRVLKRASELFDEQGDPKGLVSVIYEMSVLGSYSGRCADGVRMAEWMLPEVGDDALLRGWLLAALCRNFYELHEMEKAERYANLALREAGRLRGEPAFGILSNLSWRFLAKVYERQGRLGLALQATDRAMEVCQPERVDRMEWAWTHANRAFILALQGRWSDAARSLMIAEEVAGHSSQKLSEQICLWRGNIQRDTGDYAAAAESYRHAGNHGLVEQAVLYLWSQGAEEALPYAQAALQFYEGRDNPGDRAVADAVYGIVQRTLKSYDLARRGLTAAAAVFEHRGLLQLLASALLQLARLEYEAGSSALALTYLEKALDIAVSYDLRYFFWLDSGTFSVVAGQALKNNLQVAHVCELIRFRLGLRRPSELFPLLSFPDTHVQDRVSRILEESPMDVSVKENAVEEVVSAFSSEHLPPRVLEYIGRGLLTPELLAQLRKRYDLTWREVEIYCTYYLQPSQGQVPGDLGRRYHARQLGISENTLKLHINSIRRKLGLVQRRRGGVVSALPDEE